MRLLASPAEIAGQSVECFAPPVSPLANQQLMRAAIEQAGLGYIDFARGYGAQPGDGESFFRDWMAPYPEHLLWATKVGYQRGPLGQWQLNLEPDFLASEIEQSLKILGSPIPLLYLVVSSTRDVEVVSRSVPLQEAVQPLLEARRQGQVRHLGVANVSAPQLEELLESVPIEAVQNKFTVASLEQSGSRRVLELTRQRGLPLVAWGIFQSDDHLPWAPEAKLLEAARELEMSPQDASIALLLGASPNLVALTGASRSASLAASVAAANRRIPPHIRRRFSLDD